MRDVLTQAGPKIATGHVAFACRQEQCQDDSWYGGSIELWRAMAVDREAILALEVCTKKIEILCFDKEGANTHYNR